MKQNFAQKVVFSIFALNLTKAILVELSQDRVFRDGAHSSTPSTTKILSQFGAIFLCFTDLTLAEELDC